MSRGKILAVDDDSILLEVVQIGLEYAGFDVTTGTSAAQALAHAIWQ
jgi:CheY-like chemotaxis protein